MGVHVARFEHKGSLHWGVVQPKTELLYSLVNEDVTLAEFLKRGIPTIAAATGSPIPIGDVRLLSPLVRPCSIICQGVNYAAHRQEAGLAVKKPPFNLMFMKADTSLSGPQDNIVRPSSVELLDYELELGLIIGRPIEGPVAITNDNLHEFVAGIVITNDVSARDVQLPQQQWFKGKSYRTFCPVGPYLYLIEKQDVPRILNLAVRLEVNGEVRQSANTNQPIFGPAETISELSRIMNLYPGDLILTGTPGGVAVSAPSARMQRIARILMDEEKMFRAFMKRQRTNPRYLRNGDVIRCTIRSADGEIDLGQMETKVVAENHQ